MSTAAQIVTLKLSNSNNELTVGKVYLFCSRLYVYPYPPPWLKARGFMQVSFQMINVKRSKDQSRISSTVSQAKAGQDLPFSGNLQLLRRKSWWLPRTWHRLITRPSQLLSNFAALSTIILTYEANSSIPHVAERAYTLLHDYARVPFITQGILANWRRDALRHDNTALLPRRFSFSDWSHSDTMRNCYRNWVHTRSFWFGRGSPSVKTFIPTKHSIPINNACNLALSRTEPAKPAFER